MDATGIRRIWPALLDAVRATSRSTQAMLTNATVHSVEGDTVIISHTAAPLARRLGEARNVDAIAEALRSVLGGNWHVRTVHAAADQAGPPAPVEPPPSAPEPPRRPEPTPVSRAAVTDPDEPPPPEPPDPEEFEEPDAFTRRPDPSVDMVKLLTDKLGARPIE